MKVRKKYNGLRQILFLVFLIAFAALLSAVIERDQLVLREGARVADAPFYTFDIESSSVVVIGLLLCLWLANHFFDLPGILHGLRGEPFADHIFLPVKYRLHNSTKNAVSCFDARILELDLHHVVMLSQKPIAKTHIIQLDFSGTPPFQNHKNLIPGIVRSCRHAGGGYMIKLSFDLDDKLKLEPLKQLIQSVGHAPPYFNV